MPQAGGPQGRVWAEEAQDAEGQGPALSVQEGAPGAALPPGRHGQPGRPVGARSRFHWPFLGAPGRR
eukprot:1716239-Lingulodinium_polyedra.AAC.2